MGTSGFDWRPRHAPVEKPRVRDLRALDAAARVLSESPGIKMYALAKSCHLRSKPLRSLLGRDLVSLTSRSKTTRGRQPYWTNDQMIAALQEASSRSEGEALPQARYGELVARNGPNFRAPHAQSIRRRFGTWNAAVGAAGIPVNAPLRDQDADWTYDDVVEAAAVFIVEFGTTSGSAYRAWATGRRNMPSSAVIERVATWAEMAQGALLVLREEDYEPQWSATVRASVEARKIARGLIEGPADSTGSMPLGANARLDTLKA